MHTSRNGVFSQKMLYTWMVYVLHQEKILGQVAQTNEVVSLQMNFI